MSVSGSVRINTRLDNSQLMKDCRALKTVVTEAANAVKRAFHGREIQALEQQVEATREAMDPIVQELTEIENRVKRHGEQAVAEVIRLSMANNWRGIIWDRITETRPEKPKYRMVNGVKVYD